jgi:hypothetical protein
MHILHSIPIRSNLELKTRPKQLFGSLPLGIALPGQGHGAKARKTTIPVDGVCSGDDAINVANVNDPLQVLSDEQSC